MPSLWTPDGERNVERESPAPAAEPKTYTEEEALACSLENPEACEACQ